MSCASAASRGARPAHWPGSEALHWRHARRQVGCVRSRKIALTDVLLPPPFELRCFVFAAVSRLPLPNSQRPVGQGVGERVVCDDATDPRQLPPRRIHKGDCFFPVTRRNITRVQSRGQEQ